MRDFESFKEQIRDALQHLDDPRFEPDDALYESLACNPSDGPARIQSMLISAIDDLRPHPEFPESCRSRRAYDALHTHFVLGLTQEETAEQLFMSRRNLQRVQLEAIHILARRLWENARSDQPLTDATAGSVSAAPAPSPTRDESPDWEAAASLELDRLVQSAPEAVTDLSRAIAGVLDLVNVLADKHGVHIRRGFVQEGLEISIHPSALRQTLISAVGRLLPHVSREITIHANLRDGQVDIMLTGPLATAAMPSGAELIREIILPRGASARCDHSGGHVFLSILASSVDETRVLVIEDNADMVDFYRRCTTGTTYRIIHQEPSPDVERMVESLHPDLIVLDVMLPGIDGWELLTRLHENVPTRRIPIVICSVVKEAELALALGAAAFLSKPIPPRRFVEVLDRVHRQASAADQTPPASTEAVDQ